jgi:hypothetical protein
VPPTFLYLMAFMIWVPLAVLVWLVAGLMLFAPRTRPVGRSLALAMAGTFPGVFLFQLLAAPVVIVILLAMHVLWKAGEPGASAATDHPVVIAGSIVGAFLAFGIVLGASVAGFCEGWRVGWTCGKGRGLRDAVEDGLFARVVRRFMQAETHRALPVQREFKSRTERVSEAHQRLVSRPTVSNSDET